MLKKTVNLNRLLKDRILFQIIYQKKKKPKMKTDILFIIFLGFCVITTSNKKKTLNLNIKVV